MPTHSDPQPLSPVRTRTALALYIVTFSLLLLDNYAQELRTNFLPIVVLALCVLDSTDDYRKRLRFVLSGTIWVIVLGLFLRLVQTGPVNPAAITVKAFLKNEAWFYWPACLWLYAPLSPKLPARKTYDRHSVDEKLSRIVHLAGWALILLAGWAFATCFASMNSAESFRSFAREMGVLVPFFLFWIRQASVNPRLQRQFKGAALLLMGVIVTATFLFGCVYLASKPENQSAMRGLHMGKNSALVVEQIGPTIQETRLQFPFGHHNRLAYFSMLCVLIFTGSAFLVGKRLRTILFALALAATVNLVWTLNRGASIALILGALVGVGLMYRKRALWIFPILLVLAIGAPSQYRSRLAGAFKSATYEEQDNSAVSRVRHLAHGLKTTIRYPIAGVGYGWRNYEQHYRKQLGTPEGEALHAHNIWVQAAAETGLPGLFFFFEFIAVTVVIFLMAWRRRSGLSPKEDRLLCMWICVFTAIMAYGMVNHPLREAIGLITWTLLAVMLVDLSRMTLAEKPTSDAIAM